MNTTVRSLLAFTLAVSALPRMGPFVSPANAGEHSLTPAASWQPSAPYAASVLTTNPLAATSRSASGHSLLPQLSADGRFVVFLSDAPNLVTNDNRAVRLDVFIHELATGQNRLVSVNTNRVGGGDEIAGYPSVSSNGQCVAFASAASNLIPEGTNIASGIFVHDLAAGTTRLVSGGLPASTPVRQPATFKPSACPELSADGRWVLFESGDPQYQGDSRTTPVNQVYLHDSHSNSTTLLSVSSSFVSQGGDSHSGQASLTPDGRHTVFASAARNLDVITPSALQSHIYRRADQTVIVEMSRTLATMLDSPQNHGCDHPVASADGQSVVFFAGRVSSGGGGFWPILAAPFTLYYSQLPTTSTWTTLPLTTVVVTNLPTLTWPSLSADGRWLAYEDGTQVYRWDAASGSNLLVNVNLAGTGPGNAPAQGPVISADGNKVLFISAATDLAPNATNGLAQVFLRDLVAGTTELITENRHGTASARDHSASSAVLSADGAQVAFDSAADDLVADDWNQATDVFLRDVATHTTVLLSTRHPGLPPQTDLVASRLQESALSADGRYLAFSRDDHPLVPGDTNGWRDVFIRDLGTGETAPLNVDVNGQYDVSSVTIQPRFSTNGQYVAFLKWLPGLYTKPTNHIAWWDRAHGPPQVVAYEDHGPRPVPAARLALSPDGRCVSFQSPLPADWLVPGTVDLYLTEDIFLRDMIAGTNQLISVQYDRNDTANADSENLMFSPDGRWLLFASRSDRLVTNDTKGEPCLFARDLVLGATHLVSTNIPPGSTSRRYRSGAVVSGDSRWVAYTSYGALTNLWHQPSVLVHDLQTKTLQTLCMPCDAPALSHDGRILAAQMLGLQPQPNWPTNLLVLDRVAGTSNLILTSFIATNPPATLRLSRPLLSADGRFVIFTCQRLVPERYLSNALYGVQADNRQSVQDLYVHDRYLNAILLLSANLPDRRPGNDHTSLPLLTADGRTLVFQSHANDLAEADDNGQSDLFVARLGGDDTDDDGLDDDWELAYFDSLAGDGSGDFDHDGLIDAAEFRAGTDPTSQGSVMQVMTVLSSGTGGTTVLWSAVPGRTYRVQVKQTVDDPAWTDVSGLVTAASSTGMAIDASADGRRPRFYRVVVADAP